jgi:asparagine synthase (glutamine-hydrolysing)
LGRRYGGATGLSSRVKRIAAYLGVSREEAYALTMSAWPCPVELLGQASVSALGADSVNYPGMTWAEEMMLVDQQCYLQDDILTKVDRASMAVSLEARVPLLTHPLVEWSWRVPQRFKLAEKGDQGKLLLKEVLYRHVPKELIERPKQGFGMPMAKWLRGPLRDWAEALLGIAELEAAGLISGPIKNAWRAHLAGEDRLPQLWTVLMYLQWRQNWAKGRDACAA